jgi:hypothetical protein
LRQCSKFEAGVEAVFEIRGRCPGSKFEIQHTFSGSMKSCNLAVMQQYSHIIFTVAIWRIHPMQTAANTRVKITRFET